MKIWVFRYILMTCDRRLHESPLLVPEPVHVVITCEVLQMSSSRRTFLASSSQTVTLPLLAEVRAEARKVVVAADVEPAASAALKAVRAGGNAMDAAASACLATCMLQPSAVDLGGYVTCAVVLEGMTGKVWAVDADSTAPAAAFPSMYQVLPKNPSSNGLNENEYGCSVK